MNCDYIRRVISGRRFPVSGGLFQVSAFKLQVFLFGLSAFIFQLSSLNSSAAQTNLVTPAQYLEELPKPKFAPGHTLPPLTYSGWGSEDYETIVELADHWGYAVDFTGTTRYMASQLATPGSQGYRLAQLVKAHPDKYRAVVHVNKHYNIADYLPKNYTNFNPETGGFFSKGYYATNSNGEYLDPNGNASPYFGYVVTNGVTNAFYPVVSPNASNSDWQRTADCQIELLRMVNSNAPISIVINDGEWGLYEYAAHWRAWHRDPRFQAAMANLGVPLQTSAYNTDPRLHHYVAQQKGRELSFLAKAIAANFPDVFYYWYKTDMEKFRLYGRVAGTDYGTNYVNGSNFDSRYTVTNFALPTCESYFWSSNVGLTNNYNNYGIVIGQTSQLMQFVNWAGFMISQGRPLSYNYVSAGWGRAWMTNNHTSSYISHGHYMGLLKCYYTLGMIGGNAGNYEDYLTPFNAAFAPENPPQWLTQKIALGTLHAQFSWLESYLRNGTLLPGPYTNLLSTDQPAYDFVNGGKGGTNLAHVFVRKLNSADQWLLTAWTAGDKDESVTVSVPTLGQVSLLARTNGAVYTATTTNLTLADSNGLLPTEAPEAPAELKVLPEESR